MCRKRSSGGCISGGLITHEGVLHCTQSGLLVRQPPAPPAQPPAPPPPTPCRFEKKVRAAKRAAHSELSVSHGEWTKHNYAADPRLLSTEGLVDTLPRVAAAGAEAIDCGASVGKVVDYVRAPLPLPHGDSNAPRANDHKPLMAP